MHKTHVQSLLTHTDPPASTALFTGITARAEAMVISKAKASPEMAPTTVSTSSTTLPIVPEAADAPASMVEHRMVGERAGTAGKGQSRQPAARPCSLGWQVGVEGFESGACAPCRSSTMPTPTRPAILSHRAVCRGAHENDADQERRARSAAARHTCDDDEA